MMKLGERVTVIGSRGGLFFGRAAEIIRIGGSGTRPFLGVRFSDGGIGASISPWWFEPHELAESARRLR